MKKIVLFCLSIIFFSQGRSNTSAQSIPNGAFENWAIDSTGYLNPVDWVNQCVDSGTVILGAPTAGLCSANLTTVSYNAGRSNGGHLFFTTALNSQDFEIEGYWRGDFSDSITTSMQIELLYYNSNHQVYVSRSVYAPYENLTNWTYFSLIDSSGANGPDFIDINIIIASTSYPISGFVDDMSLSYLTGIEDITQGEKIFSVLPNPATSTFTIRTTTQLQNAQVEIYNVLGEKVGSWQLANDKKEITVDVRELSKGIYFVRVGLEKKWGVQKLIIQ